MFELKVNKDLFSAGGVLGRKDYFLTSMKLFGLIVTAYAVSLGAAFMGPTYAIAGAAFMVLASLPLTYIGYINMYKRLRDIRGTIKDQILFQSLLTVTMFLPILNLIPCCILIFMKGKITSFTPTPYRDESTPPPFQNAA